MRTSAFRVRYAQREDSTLYGCGLPFFIFPGKVTLRESSRQTGKSIVNGSIEWTFHPCCALATVPYQGGLGDGYQYCKCGKGCPGWIHKG
jgi:hypothetical protein